MLYRAVSENRAKFGPFGGSSLGIQLAMIVVVSGLSGDTNAYTSVLSAVGSARIAGASAWLDAWAPWGLRLAAEAPTPSAATAMRPATTRLRMSLRPSSLAE